VALERQDGEHDGVTAVPIAIAWSLAIEVGSLTSPVPFTRALWAKPP